MTDIPTGSPRSTFVTVVAWVFIVLGGFATLIAILHNIMIASMFPQEAMSEAANAQDLPVFVRFMMAHPQVVSGAFLVAPAITFISAIGLLKRKNWARLIFIAILVLGIVWNVMMSFPVVIVLAFAGLFGWIIKRLVSAEIKREFLAL